jgi:hypothetical protein
MARVQTDRYLSGLAWCWFAAVYLLNVFVGKAIVGAVAPPGTGAGLERFIWMCAAGWAVAGLIGAIVAVRTHGARSSWLGFFSELVQRREEAERDAFLGRRHQRESWREKHVSPRGPFSDP